MSIGYVKELDSPVSLSDKIRYYVFNEIEVEKVDANFIIRLPINEKNISKKLDKMIEKLFIQMQKYRIDFLIFSNKLSSKNESNIDFKDEFYKRKVGQVEKGKKLIQYVPFKILEYILQIQGREIEQEDVYFLIKKDNRMDLSFLNSFLKYCKTVNIITNDIARFQKIQDELYEQENILIGVSNNRSKSLRRAKYIVNVNMEDKDLEKLRICKDAIIIHMTTECKYISNGFQGINVNQVLVTLPDEYVEKFDKINALDGDKFNLEKFYETILLEKLKKEHNKSLVKTESYIKRDYYELVNEIIEKDEMKIAGLVGNNGVIREEEFILIGKKLYESEKNIYKKEKCLT